MSTNPASSQSTGAVAISQGQAPAGLPTMRRVPPGGVRLGSGERARNPRQTLFRLLGYLRPQARRLVAAGGLCDLAGPYLVGVAIDRFITNGDQAGLTRIALILGAVYIGSWAASFIQNFTMTTTVQRVMRSMRRNLFDHLQTLTLAYFDRHSTGELMSHPN